MKGNLVTVVRNGKLINISENELCCNDTVVLQPGDIVPADLLLVEAKGLEVDEFELTGEIMPVMKNAHGSETLVYMVSRVIKGTGKGKVVATGDQTEYGSVLKQVWEPRKVLSLTIAKKKYFILVAMLIPVFIINLTRSQNPVLVVMFYFLLSIILILLQNNELFKYMLLSSKIENYNNLNIQIRDMSTLECLNKIDIICFDKTGVLTSRQMHVSDMYFGGILISTDKMMFKEGMFNLIKIACAICNDISYFEKIDNANPIDKALIEFAANNGVDLNKILTQYERIYDKPFNSEERFMACGFQLNHNKIYYFAKGDPEVILSKCNCYITCNGSKKEIDFEFLRLNKSNIDAAIQMGDTLIAVSYATADQHKVPKEYTFLCLLRLGNLLQATAQKTIRKITEKGIRSVMLTGDRVEAAIKIGEKCGITNQSNAYLTGRNIGRMELSEVARQAERCSIFARLLPSQKGILIRLLQQRGHCVAMVGDGPNDGIALKVADIGISLSENSSPIARKLSKILINDLKDLLLLIDGANRMQRKVKYFILLRIVLMAIILFSQYVVVITTLKSGR